jgi:hypothetical protein
MLYYVRCLEFIRRQVLRVLHSLDKLLLFDTSLTFDISVRQDLLELFDTQLGYVLLVHLFRFDGESNGTDFRIALGDSLTHLERGHAQGKGLRNVAFDGINVVANLFFSCRKIILAAVVAHGTLNLQLGAGILLAQRVANIVHDLDAN